MKKPTSAQCMANNIKPMYFDERLAESIAALQKAERIALMYNPDAGFYLAFSGGKDSQALYHVAEMAGVKFHAEFNLTTLDPPQLVRFIRHQYPQVKINRPKHTFLQICERRKIFPSMIMRFCCAELKEMGGRGGAVLTGVRHEESSRRAQRTIAERSSQNKKRRIEFQDVEALDEFSLSKQVEGVQCIRGKEAIVINPIIHWTEQDVWYFLNHVAHVPHCELYDIGMTRIGCILCPMSPRRKKQQEVEIFPRYVRAYLKCAQRIIAQGGYHKLTEMGYDVYSVFDWWASGENVQVYHENYYLKGRKALNIEHLNINL